MLKCPSGGSIREKRAGSTGAAATQFAQLVWTLVGPLKNGGAHDIWSRGDDDGILSKARRAGWMQSAARTDGKGESLMAHTFTIVPLFP